MNRRRALRLLAVGAAAAPAVMSPVGAQAPRSGRVFRHGVASGDPTPDGVLIWTRATPAPNTAGPLAINWTVAADARFRHVVAQGVAYAAADRDYTIKVDVGGLQPQTTYWYRFAAEAEASPPGRTRTLAQGPTDTVALAVVSCASWEFGLFNAYDAIARLPHVDAVVCLGDYIYETGPQDSLPKRGLGRRLEPAWTLESLADYRARHALYKTDPDLQAAHARAPWICTWDDHEAANNCWSGGLKTQAAEDQAAWTARKGAALRAYYEWMPLRDPAPGRAFEAINRSFQFGDLAALIMLETRLLARAHQLDYETDMTFAAGPDGQAKPDLAAFQTRLDDPARQMLGPAQQAWLARELDASVAAGRPWQILGSQVVMGRIAGPNIKAVVNPALSEAVLAILPKKKKRQAAVLAEMFVRRTPYNLDAWDGYPAARERVYAACAASGARPIVISGDSHAFWANNLRDRAGAPVGVEFGASAIASAGVCDYVPGLPVNRAFREANPEVAFCDHGAKGFIVLTLTAKAAIAEFVAVSSTRIKPYRTRVLRRYRLPSTAGGPPRLVDA